MIRAEHTKQRELEMHLYQKISCERRSNLGNICRTVPKNTKKSELILEISTYKNQ